jgi:CelD/BcsL family acetyltransferase involved in cellulose biosynthesis
VEVVALRAGDTLLGVLLNLLYRGEVLFYLGALVQEADGRLKPGLLIHMMCAEARAAEGFTRYDFLAGDQRYKTQLGQPGPAMRSVLFRKPRLKFQLEDALRTLRQRWRGRAG